LIENL